MTELPAAAETIEKLRHVYRYAAMCLAYSGRCFLSAWMTDRSGNQRSYAHSCRWEYRPVQYDPETGAAGYPDCSPAAAIQAGYLIRSTAKREV